MEPDPIRDPAPCAQCLAHWERVKDQERWGAAWGLQAMAAADRAELALGAYMDAIYQLVQPHALAFQQCVCLPANHWASR